MKGRNRKGGVMYSRKPFFQMVGGSGLCNALVLYTSMHGGRRRGNRHNIDYNQGIFFTMRMVRHWNR